MGRPNKEKEMEDKGTGPKWKMPLALTALTEADELLAEAGFLEAWRAAIEEAIRDALAAPWPFTGASGPLCISDEDEQDALGVGGRP